MLQMLGKDWCFPNWLRLLAGLLLWLSAFFLLLPAASGSLPALLATFGAMVWPRPWISQMTSLLVANLYEDPSHGSASQSFSKGGFAAGCVVIVLLEKLSSSTCGTEGTFYAAAASTAFSAFLLICVGEPKPQQEARHAGQQHPARCLVLKCCMLYGLSMGLEAAVGFWLITVMTRTGFDSAVASASNVAFYMLFAVSRLVFTPCLCHRLRLYCFTLLRSSYALATLAACSVAGCSWHTAGPWARAADDNQLAQESGGDDERPHWHVVYFLHCRLWCRPLPDESSASGFWS